MDALSLLTDLDRLAFACPGHSICYRACDLAGFFGVTASHISRVRRNNTVRFPADFYLGSGIYTRAGVLALAGCLRTKKAAGLSVALLKGISGNA